MKTLKKITFVLVLTLGSLTIYAQQVPMFTNYMYNTLMVNPAYAGSRDALTVTALYRAQWVDFKGAPETQTITMHMPLKNDHIAIGLSILNDKIGPVNNTSVFVDYAYIMHLTANSKLSLGVSVGADMFNANLNTLQLDQQTDPVFMNNINNHVTPNFGFGAYYSRPRFYAGISVPELLQNNYALNPSNENNLVGRQQRNYYFITGTMLELSNNLDFKPTMLIKETPAAPVEADLTASFIIAKRLLLGAMYRTGDAFGALVGLDITPQLHIGYSYDWSYGLKTYTYNQGSDEVFLRYDFISVDQRQIHSPRYF